MRKRKKKPSYFVISNYIPVFIFKSFALSPEVSKDSMLPRQYIPSPVGEVASPRHLSGLHSHAATEHQDAQTSSYRHPDRKGAAGQHSSDQLMTRQNSTEFKID